MGSFVAAPEFDLDAEIVAVQAMAEQAANTAMGFRDISENQRDRLQIVFQGVLAPDGVRGEGAAAAFRDLRLAIMREIYPLSGRTGQPIESFNDLSRAQAHALITEFFGHDGLTLDSPITDHGRQLLIQLRDRVA
jgi:hypothetical protein